MQTKVMGHLLASASVAALLVGGISNNAAFAQEAQQAQAQTAAPFEEIVVTARRVEERLQSVPIAITAFTGADLEQLSVKQYEDLKYTVPAMTFVGSHQAGRVDVAIRGQQASAQSGAVAVDTLFADVPMVLNGRGSFYDLENVQVLKGPQGVAFGRNTLGGAILVSPHRATDKVEAMVSLDYGRWNATTLEAMVNAPIIADKLMVRVAGQYHRRDPWITNVFTGVPGAAPGRGGLFGDQNSKLDYRSEAVGRLTVQFNPTDWLETSTIFAVQHLRGDSPPPKGTLFNPNATLVRLFANTFPGGVQTYNGPLNVITEQNRSLALGRGFTNVDDAGLFADDREFVINHLDAHINENLLFKNVASVLWNNGGVNGSTTTDVDATPLAIVNIGNALQPFPRTRTITEEAQIQGTNLFDRVNWLAGVYYSNSKPVRQATNIAAPYPWGQGCGLIITAARPTGCFSDSALFVDNGSKNEDLGLFGRATVKLDEIAEGLKLTAGVRKTWNYRVINPGQMNKDFNSGLLSPTNVTAGRDDTFTGWSYEVTLDYQLAQNSMIYASHRRGFKGGNINTPQFGAIVPAQYLVVQPETAKDVEVGTKSDFNIGGVPVRVNAAVFYEWLTNLSQSQNLQFPQPNGTTAVVQLAINQGSATTRGGELDVTVKPTDTVTLNVNYAVVDASFARNTPGRTFYRIAASPKNKVSGNLTYDFYRDDVIGDMSLTSQVVWEGSKYLDTTSQNNALLQKPYALVNFRYAWQHVAGSSVDLQAYINNAFDKTYFVGGVESLNQTGAELAFYGDPRTWGLKMAWHFGG